MFATKQNVCDQVFEGNLRLRAAPKSTTPADQIFDLRASEGQRPESESKSKDLRTNEGQRPESESKSKDLRTSEGQRPESESKPKVCEPGFSERFYFRVHIVFGTEDHVFISVKRAGFSFCIDGIFGIYPDCPGEVFPDFNGVFGHFDPFDRQMG